LRNGLARWEGETSVPEGAVKVKRFSQRWKAQSKSKNKAKREQSKTSTKLQREASPKRGFFRNL
jgi:hypothetical protein